MTAKEKCIAKWQKRLDKLLKIRGTKYDVWWNKTELQIDLIEETIKDLNRLL